MDIYFPHLGLLPLKLFFQFGFVGNPNPGYLPIQTYYLVHYLHASYSTMMVGGEGI